MSCFFIVLELLSVYMLVIICVGPSKSVVAPFTTKMSHKIGSTYFVVAFDTDVYGRDGRDDINLNKGKLTEVIVFGILQQISLSGSAR